MKEQTVLGKLPEEYIEMVSMPKVLHFLDSTLAKRMMRAAKEGKLYKEQPFVYGIKADRLNQEFPASETVLIQGIIDAYFEEKGMLAEPYVMESGVLPEAQVQMEQTVILMCRVVLSFMMPRLANTSATLPTTDKW